MTALILTSAQVAALNTNYFWNLNKNFVGSADFIEAWSQTNAAGVVVSVVDGGVNYLHADLSQGQYSTAIDYDIRDTGTMDALPDTTAEHHGTEVAGLIAGDLSNGYDSDTANTGPDPVNGVGTIGAAQGATITGSYLRFGGSWNDADLAPTIEQQKNYAVSNNSYASTSPFTLDFRIDYGGGVLGTAFQDAATLGRGGLGTVLVFAAGNDQIIDVNPAHANFGQNIGPDATFSNEANSRFTIAVGAHGQDGTIAFFSDPGASVLLTAPGLGLLTDDTTASGSTTTAFFSGTSAAAPMVSSAVALMLAANPSLGYRDVQEILALSATSRVNPEYREYDHVNHLNVQVADSLPVANGANNYNGGGLMFGHMGGFGMLDTSAAVALARNWTLQSTAANEKLLSASLIPSGTGITLNSASDSLTFTMTAPTGWEKFAVSHVDLALNILTDADLADLRLELISPDGTDSVLVQNLASYAGHTQLNYTLGSAQFLGENPYGTWTIHFSHASPSGTFSMSLADVSIYGDVRTADDTYFYNSSYATLAALDATRMHVADSDGGTDTLNFAGMDAGITLDMSAASASIMGTTLYLDSAFENVIGTIYNDTLTGNSGNNVINGDLGDDTMAGGAGNDTYIVQSTGDVVTEASSAGTDLVMSNLAGYVLTANVENLTFTGSNTHSGQGNALANVITGSSGNDTLDGDAGADTLYGLGGNDLYAVDNAGDVVIEAAGQGTDIVYAMAGVTYYVLPSDVENLKNYGNTTGFTGIGNGDANVITGGTGNDYLIGLAGNDTLIDGSGLNTLQGGTGDDIYAVQSTADTVFEFASEGTDQVQTFLSSYTLSSNVEQLVFVGSSGHAGTGNVLDNLLIGSTGADVLNGLTGNDTLTGGSGVDQFVFNTALNASTNVDTITDFVHGTDQIVLDHTIFSGGLAAVSYNTGTGELTYASTLFAVLTTHPTLSSGDFLIV